MQSESIQAGERLLCNWADQMAAAFEAETAGEIIAELVQRGDAETSPGFVTRLAGLSPTSCEVILASHRAARRLPGVSEVLDLDRRAAGFMARHQDFAEGVRAQLVDKDRKPRWRPARHEQVDRDAIAFALSAPGQTSPAS
jgi:enoyl-CoA hydratase